MLNYVSNQNTDTVSVRGGATIVVSGDLCWTSESPNSKVTNTSVVVTGAMTEKGHSWTESWTFTFPASGLAKLDEAMRAISDYVDRRQPRSSNRREAYVDVFDWLRVGWIDEKEKWRGYIRFKRAEQVLESEFSDVSSLLTFSSAIARATRS